MAEYFNYFGFVMFSKIKAVTDDLIERDPVGALEVLFSVVRQREMETYQFLTGEPVASIQSGQIKPDAELALEAKEKVTTLMTSPISLIEGKVETGGRDRLLNVLHAALAVNVDKEAGGFDSTIDDQADQAATSKRNDLPQPTEEQKQIGDYPKGRLSVCGLPVSIENPAGSTRSGVDENGVTWESEMKHHYGFIENTLGADGDELDVFIKKGLDENFTGDIYVISQVNQDGSFDEHKVVIGATSIEEAKSIYLSNYDKDWWGMGRIEQLSERDFKSKFVNQNGFDDMGYKFTALPTDQQIEINPLDALHQLLGVAKQRDSKKQADVEIPLADELKPSERNTAEFYQYSETTTKGKRQKDNDAAIALLKQFDSKERALSSLTDADREVLAKYTGSGGNLVTADGKKGSAYEYYTPKPVAEGMWGLMEELGFSGGKVLDPCAGMGIFGATAPKNAVVDAVELDAVSGNINKFVNQSPTHNVTVSNFEKVAANTPDESYDAVITNVPFGDNSVRGGNQFDDAKYQNESLEAYFILRTLEKLKPNGLAMFITPPRCVSGRGLKEERLRSRASMLAEFMGAYRLPNKVFGAASADTITDVMVFKKHSRDALEKIEELSSTKIDTLIDANVLWQEFISGQYFKGEGKRFILGEFVAKDDTKYRDVDRVINDDSVQNISKLLRKFGGSRIDWEALDTQESDVISYNDGDTIYQNGQPLQYFDGVWQPVQLDEELLVKNKITESIMAKLSTPYDAFIYKISHEQATQVRNEYLNQGRTMALPNWLNLVLSQLDAYVSADKKAEHWNALLVGLSVVSLVKAYADDLEMNYLDSFKALSLAMKKYRTFKAESGLVSSFKAAIKAIGIHYNGTEYSALWRGERQSIEELQGELTADQQLQKSQYLTGSLYVDREQAKTIYKSENPNFDPLTDGDWVVMADGKRAIKVDDLCVGNLKAVLDTLDSEIASASDDDIRNNLLAAKQKARDNAHFTDVSKLSYKLNSPLVTIGEKLEFAKQFIDASAYVDTDAKGRSYVDINIKGSDLDLDSKLTNRIGDYFKNGTITLGGIGLPKGVTAEQALAKLREKINAANTQFSVWVKANPNIQARLEATAKNPENVFFKIANDDSPLEVDGISPEWKMHSYQNAEIRRQARQFGGINGFNVGLGKAQPLDAKVLTPNGWVLMGDLKVGDEVIAYDGSVTHVTGVYPQGEKDIYECIFSDGAKTRCCDEHLWLTETENDRQKSNYHARNGRIRKFNSVKSLNEIRHSLVRGKKQKNHKIPLVKLIDFVEKDYFIAPYVMGVLLGDGSFSDKSIGFCSNEIEIVSKVKAHVEQINGLSLKTAIAKDRADNHKISIGNVGGKINPYTEKLREYGLQGCVADTKFIPKEYLLGSFQQRVDLLHGLMDTDGYVSKDGITVQYYSTSQQLANDVVELVRSLGGVGWIASKIPTFKYKGEKKQGKRIYTVSIRMRPEINPFSLRRKAERVKPKEKYLPVRYFVEVKHIGKQLAQCISIDHPSHLYVTDDYIVTHNTATSLVSVQHAQNIGVKKKTLFIVPSAVLSNWRKEAVTGKGNKGDENYVAPIYANGDDCLFVGLTVDKNGNASVKSKDYDRDLNTILENRHKKIFMTYEAFQRIPMQEETIEKYVAHLRDVDSAFAELERTADDNKNESKIAFIANELMNGKSAAAPFFEDMGIDSIVIDEGHSFKNSKEAFNFESAKFLSLPQASSRALDAQAKCWYVRGNTAKNDGVLLLTATPVTNSPLEIYSMLSLAVGEEQINKQMLGIRGADDFLKSVCIVENDTETSVDGISKDYAMFTGLDNLEILRSTIGNIANVQDAESVGAVFHLPESPENAEPIRLDANTMDKIKLYQQAYRAANAIKRDKPVEPEELKALEIVVEETNEDASLIAEPFNLIQKMNNLSLDAELNKRVTFVFVAEDKKKIDAVVAAFNKLKIVVKGVAKLGQYTEQDSIVKTYKVKDGEKFYTRYDFQVKVRYDEHQNAIILDSIDFATQAKLEKILDDNELDFDYASTPKYAALVNNVKNELEKPRGLKRDGSKSRVVKQIVFSDMLATHNKIRRILNKKAGIPLHKITFISGQFNNEPEQLLEVQAGFNGFDDDNLYNIIIGNKKAEVGINLQSGTQAIHHLTIGWTPDSLTQRNGRGVRQGNMTKNVNIYYYDAEGTFDAYKRRLVNKKEDWINNLLTGDSQRVSVSGGLTKEQQNALINMQDTGLSMEDMQAQMEQAELKARSQRTITTQVAQINTISTAKYNMAKYSSFTRWVDRTVGELVEVKKRLIKTEKDLNSSKISENKRVRLEQDKAMLLEVVASFSEQLRPAFVKQYSDEDWAKEIAKVAVQKYNDIERVYDSTVNAEADSALKNEWQDFIAQNERVAISARQEVDKLSNDNGVLKQDDIDTMLRHGYRIIQGQVVTHGTVVRFLKEAQSKIAPYGFINASGFSSDFSPTVYAVKDGKPFRDSYSLYYLNPEIDIEIIEKNSLEYEAALRQFALYDAMVIKNNEGKFTEKDSRMLASYHLPRIKDYIEDDFEVLLELDAAKHHFKLPLFPMALDRSNLPKGSGDWITFYNQQDAISTYGFGGALHVSSIDAEKLDDGEIGFDSVLDFMQPHGLKFQTAKEMSYVVKKRFVSDYGFTINNIDISVLQKAVSDIAQATDAESIADIVKQSVDKTLGKYIESLHINELFYVIENTFSNPVYLAYKDLLHNAEQRLKALDTPAAEVAASAIHGVSEDDYVYMLGDSYRAKEYIDFRAIAKQINADIAWHGKKVRGNDVVIIKKAPNAPVNTWVMQRKVATKIQADHAAEVSKYNLEFKEAS